MPLALWPRTGPSGIAHTISKAYVKKRLLAVLEVSYLESTSSSIIITIASMRLVHFMKPCSQRILKTIIFLEAREHQVHTLKSLLLQLLPGHVRYLRITIEFVGINVSISLQFLHRSYALRTLLTFKQYLIPSKDQRNLKQSSRYGKRGFFSFFPCTLHETISLR